MPELHEVMSPVWEVWPELKPQGLSYRGDSNFSSPWSLNLMLISIEQTAALCIASMEEGLACMHSTYSCGVTISFDTQSWTVEVWDKSYTAPTRVEAFAAACLAVKGAQEVPDGK